jgi:hypothetical protein
LPDTAIGETLATKDSCATVNGVGVAVGWQYSEAENPGNTLFGSAIFNSSKKS